eukprot:scaffold226028_cov20-Tisochrysis_lutea.AAC.1
MCQQTESDEAEHAHFFKPKLLQACWRPWRRETYTHSILTSHRVLINELMATIRADTPQAALAHGSDGCPHKQNSQAR